MSVLNEILNRAATPQKSIVLSEGTDDRVVRAALAARRLGLAQIILLGAAPAVQSQIALQDGDGVDGIRVIDPARSDLLAGFSAEYLAMRRHKGMTADLARQTLQKPLYFAAMLVRQGLADGTVGGAVATTADTVRAAIQVIGPRPGCKLVSSFFLMLLAGDPPSGGRAVVFADCALVVRPSAEELAAIACDAAQSFAALTGEAPRVAMLSFSTAGSATHPEVDKVIAATALARQTAPELMVDGDMQFDAAFVPSVAAAKAPNSPVAGRANVFVFPNLAAGNIGYKIAQRIGGATAIGPILQGLARPANDLSRGCSSDDVLHMIAVTALQAQLAQHDAP